MSAHTPGPWTVSDRYPLDVMQGGEIVIAGCRSENEARLIAAAPSLLEVLVDLNTDDGLYSMFVEFYGPLRAAKLTNNIRAAIRAAKGESHA